MYRTPCTLGFYLHLAVSYHILIYHEGILLQWNSLAAWPVLTKGHQQHFFLSWQTKSFINMAKCPLRGKTTQVDLSWFCCYCFQHLPYSTSPLLLDNWYYLKACCYKQYHQFWKVGDFMLRQNGFLEVNCKLAIKMFLVVRSIHICARNKLVQP